MFSRSLIASCNASILPSLSVEASCTLSLLFFCQSQTEIRSDSLGRALTEEPCFSICCSEDLNAVLSRKTAPSYFVRLHCSIAPAALIADLDCGHASLHCRETVQGCSLPWTSTLRHTFPGRSRKRQNILFTCSCSVSECMRAVESRIQLPMTLPVPPLAFAPVRTHLPSSSEQVEGHDARAGLGGHR